MVVNAKTGGVARSDKDFTANKQHKCDLKVTNC